MSLGAIGPYCGMPVTFKGIEREPEHLPSGTRTLSGMLTSLRDDDQTRNHRQRPTLMRRRARRERRSSPHQRFLSSRRLMARIWYYVTDFAKSYTGPFGDTSWDTCMRSIGLALWRCRLRWERYQPSGVIAVATRDKGIDFFAHWIVEQRLQFTSDRSDR
jgi:hypothetical protein